VASVEPRRAGESFTVQTTRYQVTVKGTIFAVRERSDDDVTVSVSRGLVEVSGNGGVWQVPAGRAWHSTAPSNEGPDEISPRDRSLLEQAETTGPVAPIRVEGPAGSEVTEDGVDLGPAPITWNAPIGRYHFVGTAALEQAEGDASTQIGGAATVRLVAPVGARAPVPTQTAASTSAVTRRQAARPSARGERAVPAAPAKPELLARLDTPPPSPIHAAVPDQATAPAPSAAPVVLAPDPYVDALALSHSGRFRDAAQALDLIAQRGLPHADLALYNLAELRKKQLHDPAGALQAYLRYEQQYPAGSLVQEVELSAIELNLKASAFPAAMSQIDRFLSDHGDSERAPEVHQLRGNLLRERGDCGGAIGEYGAAKGDGLDDDSLYFTAWCQQKLGKGPEAASCLREYLQRFPHGLHVHEVQAALESR
jgi:tetratricopeptide (TPR) repeat protein